MEFRPEGYDTMSDDELIQWIRSHPDLDEDSKLVHEALSRIVIAFKKKGIDCGCFAWFGENSFGLTNADCYAHLGRIHDYGIRYANSVINSEE